MELCSGRFQRYIQVLLLISCVRIYNADTHTHTHTHAVRQRARPVNPVQPVPLHPHQRLPPLSPPSIPPVRHSIKPQSQQKIVQQSKKSRPQVGIQVKKPTPKKQPPPDVYSAQFQRDDFPVSLTVHINALI